MKFTVVTPVFNGLPGIRQTVGSLRRQTMEVEHLVQDGLSRDGTPDWLAEHATRLQGNGYTLDWQSEKDQGMYDAINKGWARSTGEVLSWLNHDEQYLPDTLGKVAEVFSSNPEVDVVFGNFICVDGEGRAVAARREIPARRLFMRYCTCYVASCTAFFRRRVFEAGDLLLDDRYRYSADKKLFLQLLNKAYRFHHIRDYLALFTLGRENLSAKFKQAITEEDDQIRDEENVSSFPPLVQAVKLGRYVHKLLAGSYQKTDLTYEYGQDETASIRRFQEKNVGQAFLFE